jgi:endonuclease-3
MKVFAGLSQSERAAKVVTILRQATRSMIEPAATQIVARYGQNPYLVLISCLLSLRTKDTVSLPASIRLFDHAQTPEQMLSLSLSFLEKTIYPVGFYRNKAKTIQAISRDLLDRFNGVVPATEAELLTLKGVGRKTANLVLGEGFGIPAICVDTHVHRISNRLGLVATTTPEATEAELKKVLPEHLWVEYNRLLVMWGQNICVPLSPRCSACAVAQLCPRVGVTRSR